MIIQESKTLRDYILRLVDKKGNKIVIKYGYDMSSKHSGHYVTASINGSDFNSKKGTLSKLKSLKIPALTQLIQSIGRDVTGSPENYIEEATKLIERMDKTPSKQNWQNLLDYYQAYSEKEDKALTLLLEKYLDASPRARRGLLSRYLLTRRITFIDSQKHLIKALRVLYMKGVTVGDKTYMPRITGYLDKHPYYHYYKRDIDYIRKARVNLYSKVLKRPYVTGR